MFTAVNDFILKYAPGVTQERLFRGYSNRLSLPESQDFTVYSLANAERIGTNVNEWGRDEVKTKTLRQYVFDIDFCNIRQEKARMRAATIATLGRSYIAARFFEKRNIALNYATDISYLPYVDLTEQYIHRCRVSLYLTAWDEVNVAEEYAENVRATVENIDAHHKIKE